MRSARADKRFELLVLSLHLRNLHVKGCYLSSISLNGVVEPFPVFDGFSGGFGRGLARRQAEALFMCGRRGSVHFCRRQIGDCGFMLAVGLQMLVVGFFLLAREIV